MTSRRRSLPQFGQNHPGKLLAKLDAPLIEGIYVPDNPLGENLVLVERYQKAQRPGIELAKENRVGRTVALEHLVRHQGFQSGARDADALQFGAHLFRILAAHQRFRLGEEVGEQDRMVLANRVLRLDRGEEIGRNDARPLVDKLIEGVLSVGPRLAEKDRTGPIIDPVAVAIDRLAVALHIELLKISREAMQVLVVGQYRIAVGTEEIGVPDADQPE